jgi:hypothetical protein
MAASGFTPIQLYRTTTGAAVPLAADLLPGELGFNIANTDMALYAENASGTVTRIMNNPAGLKYPTADGSANQVIKTDGAGILSFTAAASGDVTLTGTQTLTNKTIAYGSNTLTDVVGVTATQTLTNKTLTAPTIASANLTTALTLAGAAGTNGQVLTSAGSGLPTWSTPAGSALVFISSQTVTTTVASVDFTSGIDATYDNYYVVFSNMRIQNGGRLSLRLRQATTFVTADCFNLNLGMENGQSPGFAAGIRDHFMANGGGTPTSETYYSGYFTLSSANNTTRRVPVINGYSAGVGNTSGSSTAQLFSGSVDVAGAITGFQFLSQSGNLTAGGTVALYGIKTS